MRRSEQKFRDIFNTSNDAIIVTDLDSRILEVNNISLQRTGLMAEQITKLKLLDIIDKNDRQEAEIQFRKLAENKTGIFHSSYINLKGEKSILKLLAIPSIIKKNQLL
ncbi:MAG: PAS domain S-box protein [Bacteroidetes bacterium]|nr:PAS domain S-box protein [Bacteroidota bacterium]